MWSPKNSPIISYTLWGFELLLQSLDTSVIWTYDFKTEPLGPFEPASLMHRPNPGCREGKPAPSWLLSGSSRAFPQSDLQFLPEFHHTSDHRLGNVTITPRDPIVHIPLSWRHRWLKDRKAGFPPFIQHPR